jgi:hypothetical protein
MRQSVGLIAVREVVFKNSRIHAADGEAVEKSIARRTTLVDTADIAADGGGNVEVGSAQRQGNAAQ